MIYLIDTSIWINYLHKNRSPELDFLTDLLRSSNWAVCGIVLQELLQGSSDQKEFDTLKRYFENQSFLAPADASESHCAAAAIYFDCRRSGLTPRSPGDCMIAQLALENQATLIHNDRDFIHMTKVRPDLKLAPN